MNRAHNFYAGPAILPIEVVEETAKATLDFNGTGMSIMEISHRSKEFDAVIKEAQADCLKIAGLSADEYSVVFVGGGASLQFAMVPMNFLHSKADYINTGAWSSKAIKEAKAIGEVNVAASSEAEKFTYIPKEYNLTPGADYVHITTNNTIYGTEWKSLPETNGVPLVADMSSNMFSRRYDFSKCDLIYAGAQKNIGPSGVVLVIVKKSWIEEKAKKDIPTMLRYKTHSDKESLYNTPPVLPIFAVGKTFKWILKQGGLEAIEKLNAHKSGLIYEMIDKYPEFYRGAVTAPEDRSMMNIPFTLPSTDLEAEFVKGGVERKMFGLKGHRDVGGIRASVYNACPLESCEALAKYMQEFYDSHK